MKLTPHILTFALIMLGMPLPAQAQNSHLSVTGPNKPSAPVIRSLEMKKVESGDTNNPLAGKNNEYVQQEIQRIFEKYRKMNEDKASVSSFAGQPRLKSTDSKGQSTFSMKRLMEQMQQSRDNASSIQFRQMDVNKISKEMEEELKQYQTQNQ